MKNVNANLVVLAHEDTINFHVLIYYLQKFVEILNHGENFQVQVNVGGGFHCATIAKITSKYIATTNSSKFTPVVISERFRVDSDYLPFQSGRVS